MKTSLILAFACLILPTAGMDAHAQFTFTTNNGSITITGYSDPGYSGPGGDLIIPPVITGLPVTSIGTNAFYGTEFFTVSIPDSVTSIGDNAFAENYLTSITIPDGVVTIGDFAFYDDEALQSAIVGNNVTSIGHGAFAGCSNLPEITIGKNVTNIADAAFAFTGLGYVYFQGNAPSFGPFVFEDDGPVFCYLPGTTGWGTNVAGFPTVLWNPQILTNDAGFGVRSNEYGFDIAFTNNDNAPVVVEVTSNLVNPVWTPLQTITITNGLFHFSEPFQRNSASRFYRLNHQLILPAINP